MKITLAPLLLPLVSAVLVSADMRKHLFDNPHARRANIDHLGRRDTSKNGMAYPEPGTTIPAQMPQAWRDKLKQAEAAGKIPNIPPSKTNWKTELSIYPPGVKDSELCSWTNTQCIPQGAISETPAKTVGMAVDDGPVTDAITSVEPIVQEHKVSMSHFLIGSQILWDVPAMTRLAQMDPPRHLCSHSFTHTFMTNHSNEQVVADLGWSMQLIYDYSGKIPLYWRPPAGDVDNRVTAIAKEVLGMQLVMWNRDTFDWCTLNDGSIFKGGGCEGVTKDKYEKDIDGWVAGGEGIVPLAHEARKSSAPYFKMLIEKAIAKGYTVGPIPHAQSLPWYQNANDASDKGTPAPQDSILPTKQPFTVKDKGATAEGGVDWGDYKKGASTGTVAGNTPAAANSSSSMTNMPMTMAHNHSHTPTSTASTSTTGSGSSTSSTTSTTSGTGSASGSGTTSNPTPSTSGGDTALSAASVTVAFLAASLVAAVAACF